ncbi:hypothetical protein ACFQ0B_61155 [Nonomuraea thailandensis]
MAGHDIGGGIAQHLLAGGVAKVRGLALVNAVTYDSWPVPAVARYRDPAVVAGTTVEDLLAARRQAVTAALARPASEQEVAGYLDPWNDPRVCRSWMALAAAADGRYTLDLVPALRADETPKLLVWGRRTPSRRCVTPSGSPRRCRTRGSCASRGGPHPHGERPGGVASALAAFFSM